MQPPPEQLHFYRLWIIGGWGFVYGWMPVNIVHNILYIAVGVGGLGAIITFTTARWYCIGLFWLSLQLMVIGFLPWNINNLWGFCPLFGWNVMLHTITAIAAWYYGYVYPLDLVDPALRRARHPLMPAPDAHGICWAMPQQARHPEPRG